jgi:hypothetical protein
MKDETHIWISAAHKPQIVAKPILDLGYANLNHFEASLLTILI